MRFASAAARAAKLVAPEEGMVTYLEDEDRWYGRQGAAWEFLSGAPVVTDIVPLANWESATNGGRPARLIKHGGRLITMEGAVRVKVGFIPPSGAFYNLPAGSRPVAFANFIVYSSNATGWANVQIDPTTGAMSVVAPVSSQAVDTTYDLSSIKFRAA